MEQALVTAEDTRAEAAAAIRERDAMAVELRSSRDGRWHVEVEAEALRARLEEAERKLARHDSEAQGRLDRAEMPNAEVQTLAEQLHVANEELRAQGEELTQENVALARANQQLERRVAERTAELADANAMLRAATDTMPYLVWSSHPGGAWQYANRRWTEYAGQPAKEAAKFRWLDPVHPEDRDCVLQAWRAALDTGELLGRAPAVRPRRLLRAVRNPWPAAAGSGRRLRALVRHDHRCRGGPARRGGAARERGALPRLRRGHG
jgi:PAS domain-containing protein